MRGIRIPNVLTCVLCLLASVFLIASCAETPTPTPTSEALATSSATAAPLPTSSPTIAVATPVVEAATATEPAATQAPTGTSTWTPIPLPPHAPVITNRVPAPGEELRADAPILISFDQPMDRQSVEFAFGIEPAIKGDLSWSGNTLAFRPAQGALLRDAVYRVSINETARNAAGMAIQEPALFRLRTVGYLEVTDVQPAVDAIGVAMDSDVIVAFNRPVVPLTSVGAQGDLPHPLRFDPPVNGRGEWLNTSIYAFHPTQGFLPATRYQARVTAGLGDTTGGELADDHVWSFTTKLPAVIETLPFDGAVYVAPTQVISVTFNQPMDHASAEAAFALFDRQGNRVPGGFRWEKDALIFSPTFPLLLGDRYNGIVTAGALAAIGGQGTSMDYAWSFAVIEAPRVLSTRPGNGVRTADPYTDLQITFSGPIDPATLKDNLTIIPEPTEVYSSWARSDTRLWISFGARPSTSYQVTLGENLAGRYGHKLGTPYSMAFSTRALDPQVYMDTNARVGTYNAYTETVVLINHVNVPSVDLSLYRLTQSDFALLNESDWWSVWDGYQPSRRDLIRAWSWAVSSPLNAQGSLRMPIATEEGGELPPGLYFLAATGPGIQRPSNHMMVVTRTNLMIKHGEQEVLVWATDLASGQPLADVSLDIVYEGVTQVQGATGPDGVFQAAVNSHGSWQPLFVFAQRGDESTVALSNWSNDIDPWQFDLTTDWGGQPHRGILYTDRPLYRPGQKVYFKGIVRTDDDGHYGIPAWEHIQVVVHDSQGNNLYEDRLPLNDFGSFFGELTLGDEAALGNYYIEAMTEEPSFYVGESFQVAEYRKPEFLVDVVTDRDSYIQGDTVAVNVEASYFFGGPLRDAEVRWSLLRQNYHFHWDGGGWWDFNDLDLEDWQRPATAFGELVSQGRARTDSEGRLAFQIPANISDKRMSQVFTIEASVVDANDQEVSARASAIVHKGLFYVGLQPQGYVGSAGKEMSVNVVTVDPGGDTVAGVGLDVAFYEHRWFTVQERDPDGRLRWVSKAEDTLVAETEVVTDGDGRAVASFVPEKGGAYRVRATGRDQRGNEVSASTYLWVSSRDFTPWPRANNDRIELVPDKKSYAPGDMANILVPSPYQGETKALLTIERGHIMEYRVLTLRSNSEQVAIPITSQHVPNVYVSVFIIKGQDETNPLASFKLGYVSLPVSPQEKEMRITLSPDRDTYRPGDTAAYDVRVTDQAGNGVTAELSLALIDLSVLTLSGDQGPDLMDRFYRERGLGIQTASTLAISVDEYVAELARDASGKGGDGGGEGGLDVRQDFPDTVYWNPSFRTDARGEGSVQVTLADNLTTWRMRAQGITLDTEVGDAQVDIIATKELLIRPVTPRFFVVGDRAQLSAVVHNNTDAEIDAVVTLQATGLQVDQAERQVRISAHGLAKVVWQTSVQPADSAEIIFSVLGGGLSDAAMPLFGSLPIYRYIAPETVATSGQVEEGGQRIEVVQLPANADTSQGDLRLKLEPSLAAGMRDGLTYLKTYPYDCIEQTVSRFLPNVITYRALRGLDIQDAELEAELPTYVSKGLQRIYALQHFDGGWGWWVSDDSNAYLTGYVLFGLIEAQRAGFAVDKDVMARAASFLEGSLDEPMDANLGYRANSRAFVLYVLAEFYVDHQGAADLGRAVALYERRDILSNYGKAYLAMALNLMAPGERSRLDALVSDLSTAAIRSATGAHWEEDRRDHWTMNTDTRTTSLVLRALVQTSPEHPLIPGAVRWLMVARRQGRWETTQETAWSIIALTDYMVASGELQGDYGYRIGLNGGLWDEGSVTPDTVQAPRELRVAVSELLRDTGNQIWLEREAASGQTGQGKLYYSVYLRYYLPVRELEALNRGIIISRQYTLLDEPERTVDQVRLGDVIQVKLTIIAPNDLYYLVVEDPLPAGCEAVDTSLKTTSAIYQGPELEPLDFDWDHLPYWWFFSHSELRDEKVALFATELAKGTYEYTYLMRASLPGEFSAMPAQAYEMYFPEVFGRSDGGLLVIAEE